jgi:hypothetical protein
MTLEEALANHWEKLVAVSTGLYIVFLKYIDWKNKKEIKKRKEMIQDEDRDISLAIRYKKQADIALENLVSVQMELFELRKELSSVYKSPEELLEKIVSECPHYLMWIKKRISKKNYIMVVVNKEYASKLLQNHPDFYKGKSDLDIWGEETAKIFSEHDELVFATQNGIHVEEEVRNSLSGISGVFRGVKYPIRIKNDNYIVGIGLIDEE